MSCFIFMNIIKHLFDEVKGNTFWMMDLRKKKYNPETESIQQGLACDLSQRHTFLID